MAFRRRKAGLIAASLFGVLLVLWMALGYAVAFIATKPRPRDIPREYVIGGQPVENVEVRSEDGVRISSWLVRKHGKQAVILLHGISADRRQCAIQAGIFLEAGFDVMLPDLRGQGASDATTITVGWTERRDLKACYRYLREQGYQRIGAYGLSLGAATIAYSLPEIGDLSFVVLESSYDTMEHALDHRLDLWRVPHWLAWPVRWWGSWITGARESEMAPVAYMPHCKVPALILSGDAELVLSASETTELYNRCASPLKRLHVFKGGTHGRLRKQFPEEYAKTTRGFLDEVTATWPK